MRTITFYSYKGGVGRTLALANLARYLASFGQRVFALDLDLEAPGLHYKLASPAEQREIRGGVVDAIHALVRGEITSDSASAPSIAPDSLRDFVTRVEHLTDTSGSIHLMPAGRVPSAAYWRKLAQVSFHDLFYAEGARGIPFFLELKARIAAEYEPDYLLIDARTGITELGGVATTLLPDRVICLLANNPENLEGARAVLRSIRRTPRLPGRPPVEILPVVARIPKPADERVEEALLDRVRAFLNEPADDLTDTLDVPEIFVLHSEPELQITEALRVGGDKTPDESLLLRDYLRLFMQMFSGVIEPKLLALVEGAVKAAMDDPDGAQKRLEALTVAFPHPQSYRALLQYYRLRQVGAEKVLRMAYRYWELSRRADDALLWEVVSAYSTWEPKQTSEGWAIELLDAVWSAQASADISIGRAIAHRHASAGRNERALEILDRMTQSGDGAEVVAIERMRLLRKMGRPAEALALAERDQSIYTSSPDFQAVWAEIAVGLDSHDVVQRLLDAPGFKLDLIRQTRPSVWWSVLTIAGLTEGAEAELDAALAEILRRGSSLTEAMELGRLYRQLGRLDHFEKAVRGLVKDKERIDTILSSALRESQRSPAARTWLPPRGGGVIP